MVVDTSAILAVFLAEPQRDQFLDLIGQADSRLLSAGNALEAAIVLEARRGESVIRELDSFVHRTGMDIVPFDAEQVDVARAAWRRYGKGRHPAGLNFGDCFAYALAKTSGEPLLATGSDFARTDIVLCL